MPAQLIIRTVVALSALAAFALAQTPSPSPSLRKDGRFYELRIYHAAPGKLEALHERFRKHTLAIFKKHGMEVVGFWGPTDAEKGAENELIYILSYPSREAREKAWKAFQADPEWIKARTESEVNGKLAEKVDSIYMNEVDYFKGK